jgi:hypothetical protein
MPERIQPILRPFLEGFRAPQQGGVLVQAAFLSGAIWLTITLQLCVWCEPTWSIFLLGGVFLMAITVVGVAIPTPGGVEASVLQSLGLVNFFSLPLPRIRVLKLPASAMAVILSR